MAQLKDLLVNGKSKILDNLTVDGSLSTGSGLTTNGDILANGGFLKSTNNGNTVSIGSDNASFCNFANSLNIPFYFNNSITPYGSIYPYNNSAFDLGTTTKYWNNIYANYYYGALVPETLTDLNSATKDRLFIAGRSAANKPESWADYTAGITIATDSNSSYLNQLAFYGASTTNELYIRSEGDNSWGSWRKVLTDSDTQTISGQKTFTTNDVTVKGVGVKLEASSTTVGCTMTYDSTEECMKFTFN